MSDQEKNTIVIIGDIMLDQYIVGRHTRQSPEAEVPIIAYTKTENRLGGAGNVALNLQALGLKPILISAISDDETGELVRQLCKEHDIEACFVTASDRPTTLKQRFVDEAFRQYLRMDKEATAPLPIATETEITIMIKAALQANKVGGIVLQDYNKGVLTPYVIKMIQEESKQRNISTFADPKKDNFLLLSSCTVFKPNLKELSNIAGETIPPEKTAIYNTIKDLKIAAEYCFVTLAEHGVFYLDNAEEKCEVIPGKSIQNPDVSGAGDTVLSALIYSHINNYSPSEQAQFANKAGAIVCEKKGVSVVTLTELS